MQKTGISSRPSPKSELEHQTEAMEPTDTSRHPPIPRKPSIVLTDPQGLSVDTFFNRYGEVVAYSSDSDFDWEDDSSSLVSPFEDPAVEEESSLDRSSSWSSSNSDSSSGDSSDSDSESDEMDFIYDDDNEVHHQLHRFATIHDGFVSFPTFDSHSPKGLPSPTESFFGGLDAEDLRDAEELLRGEDDDDLVGAIEAVEREYAESGWTRPVPKWTWLKASNSFPVLRLSPTDFRHGRSKLRMAASAADEPASPSDGGSSRMSTSGQGDVADVAMRGVPYV